MPAAAPDPRISVVVITHNRRAELLHVLDRLTGLPERPAVVVVDNASTDGSAAAAAAHGPDVRVIRRGANLGAVGRNVGVSTVSTPYVAFCDDDTWWEPGALGRGADILDSHPRVAAITGRILVEPERREDPITPELRDSPLPRGAGAAGPVLLSILAGASILRVRAFREVGGFCERLWLGGEEELLSLDLATAGWLMCWRGDVCVHHAPSHRRDARHRRRLGIRNTVWTAWLRRPVPSALRHTREVVRSAPRDAATVGALAEALAGAGWVLRHRRVVPEEVERGLRLLEEPRRRSRARRYVG